MFDIIVDDRILKPQFSMSNWP